MYHLCLFRQREHPHSFVPDPTQFPLSGPRPLPYIFSGAEIVRLLTTAEALAPHKGSPLHREVARVGIVILYTTGLRRGELVRLTLSDYEQADRVFHVRRSKFDKSRLVPLSADTPGNSIDISRLVAKLVHHVTAMRRCWCTIMVRGFVVTRVRAFGSLLRKVIRAAGIRTSQGRAPRVHDLRFTFAVQALLRWYRSGVDVQARLPALATYLGHASVVSTQYYLTFLQATAEAASERFHTHSAAWLSPVLCREVVDDTIPH